MSKRKNSKVPPTVRLGLALLIVGAITVGIGTISNRVGIIFIRLYYCNMWFFLIFCIIILFKKTGKTENKKIK